MHCTPRRMSTFVLAAGLAVTGISAATHGGDIDVASTRLVAGLNLPTFVTHAPGDDERLFILEKPGRIKVFNLESGHINQQNFLDIVSLVGGGTSFGSEQGLLGLAFHPNYQENGYFYVHYTNTSGANTIRRYSVQVNNPDLADPTSGLTLLVNSQIFANHNGGWLGFGPEGYLYAAIGDGGGAGDTGNNGQDIGNLLGTMIRIDVDNPDRGSNYGIPDDNPFVGEDGRDEIWGFGLRHPWRNSFDRLTGDLWIGDVGQGSREEIDFQPAGDGAGWNYGWRCYEGNQPFNLNPPAGDPPCPDYEDTAQPIHVYPISGQSECAVVGGYVYRGCAMPELQGIYLFGDYCSAKVWAMEFDGQDVQSVTNIQSQLSPSVEGFNISTISSFGEDNTGEVYILSNSTTNGALFKIIPADGKGEPCPVKCPGDLDDSGAVDGADLAVLLGAWGPCGDPDNCPADLDGSSTVDGADLAVLLGAWGTCE